jgi:small-conductance mechanosensitive channel
LTNWQECSKIHRLLKNATKMESIAYRVVSLQAVIAIFSAVLLYFLLGMGAAKAAFFGGMAASINGLFFLRKLKQAEAVVESMPSRALGFIYSSAVVRFFLVIVLFGVGFGIFKLQVIPALIVFAIAQLAYGWGLRESYKDLL